MKSDRRGASTTAEVVCYMRATEQRQPQTERIVDDPYAREFLGPVLRSTLAALEATGRVGDAVAQYLWITTYILARHRFIDDHLTRALGEGIEQLVLLGAGYDTRAYRLAHALGDRPVFEVDHPATARRKQRIVERLGSQLPTAHVQRVEIDFETQSLRERLLEAGFRPGLPTFVVWEGVSMYLRRNAVKDTLATVHALLGPGSALAMDFWYLLDSPDLRSTAHRASTHLLHFVGEPMTFGIHPEDVGPFLERLGFALEDLADGTELERRYVTDGRKIVPATYVVHASRCGA